jgi:hypothetical protein
MNIGKLYQTKKFYWFLYPSKDKATTPAAPGLAADEEAAAAYSKRFNCNVSYISPNSVFVLLEQDGEFIKILTTNGEVGWIYLADWCKDDIEEMNQ